MIGLPSSKLGNKIPLLSNPFIPITPYELLLQCFNKASCSLLNKLDIFFFVSSQDTFTARSNGKLVMRLFNNLIQKIFLYYSINYLFWNYNSSGLLKSNVMMFLILSSLSYS